MCKRSSLGTAVGGVSGSLFPCLGAVSEPMSPGRRQLGLCCKAVVSIVLSLWAGCDLLTLQ